MPNPSAPPFLDAEWEYDDDRELLPGHQAAAARRTCLGPVHNLFDDMRGPRAQAAATPGRTASFCFGRPQPARRYAQPILGEYQPSPAHPPCLGCLPSAAAAVLCTNPEGQHVFSHSSLDSEGTTPMSSVAPPGAPPLLGTVANPSFTDAPPPPPRSLPDDLIPGILLRLPPDDPAGIVRASAVCKAWRRTIADPAFAGRYRALHPKAPVLGFLHNQSSLHVSRFVPTTSFRPSPAADHRRRHAHDCRHGRALFYDYGALQSFVVWDPVTGALHKIPEVPDVLTQPAVVYAAAAGDCDHRGCGGGPFIIAFAGVENIPEEYYHDGHACFYASDTGDWSVHINIHLDHGRYRLVDRPAALVGDELYFVGKSGFLLRYRYGLLRQIGSKDILSAGVREADVLSVIKPPANAKRRGDFIAMAAQDGGLGLAGLYGGRLSLWGREMTGRVGKARSRWVQARVIDLKTMLLVSNPKWKPCLSGVAEDASVIFLSTEEDGVYTIDLKLSQVKKVGEMGKVDLILPFVSFYTDSLLLKLANGKLPAANVGNL